MKKAEEPSIKNKFADITSTHEWGMRDFNNVETADRKLVVNNKLEFWVHDEALASYSDYFAELFGVFPIKDKSSILENLTTTATNNGNGNLMGDYKKTLITLPHEQLFFDVLLWIYTKDKKKLIKAAKTFHPFLYLISLGIHLKMKSEFFEILLTKPNLEWNVEYFHDAIWSKTIFTFPILETIVDQMKTNNYTKLIALLSWLKEIDPNTKVIINTPEVLEQILTSQDLFLVRNYIQRQKLMSGRTGKEIASLLKQFPQLHSSFDTCAIVEEFIFASSKKLICLICKKQFNSPFEIAENNECKGEIYHPKNSVHLRSDKMICPHEGCGRKLVRNEYPCCHKGSGSSGCTFGEGKHLLVFAEY